MKLVFHDTYLQIKLSIKERIASFHGSFDKIPYEKIKSATNDTPQTSMKDMKMPGTDLFGVFRAGSFVTPRGHEFWHASLKKNNFLIIELEKDKDTFDRIILSTDNHQELKDKINDLVSKN